MKLKISMPYPSAAINFEHPISMACRPCRTLEASFLEDLVPPSQLVCHIPLKLITLNIPRPVGPAALRPANSNNLQPITLNLTLHVLSREASFLEDLVFFFFFFNAWFTWFHWKMQRKQKVVFIYLIAI